MKKWDKILSEVNDILRSDWKIREGRKIPEVEDIKLGNDAVKIECAVFYADMRGSTMLVQTHKDTFAAKMYKLFLRTACDVIQNNDGVIVFFDGDRVMAVFYGDCKCSNSAKAGLQLNAIVNTINMKIIDRFPATSYKIDYSAGIDMSEMLVVRTGIRNSNDLAWIGTAANNAAKLSELRSYKEKTFITQRVFNKLAKTSKYNADGSKCMWKALDMRIMGEPIFGSSWFWSF